MAVHPALRSWRDNLPAAFVQGLAVLCGLAVLSVFCAWIFQPQKKIGVARPAQQTEWNEIARPFPAFALSIPEAADAPSHYAILHNVEGGGSKDILMLGDPDSASPYLQVEIYRPGREIRRFGGPKAMIAANAAALGPVALYRAEEPLASKFGPLEIVAFEASKGVPRHCLAFVRSYDDPRLQLSGWFCQGGADFIERSTLACALDRLTLLSAGSEPKVGALFAKAELNRSYCGQHDPILASTPKYTLLWKALPTRPEPRRIGR
jgi:hypothetical protein